MENRLLWEPILRNESRETVRTEAVEFRFPTEGGVPAWRAKEKGAKGRGRLPSLVWYSTISCFVTFGLVRARLGMTIPWPPIWVLENMWDWMPWMSLSFEGQNAVDNQPGRRNGTFVSVLWKRLVLAFLAIFSDETTNVEESSTASVFVFLHGSFPQEPDRQESNYTCDGYACYDESDDVKSRCGRTASISGKDVNGLRSHWRNGGSMGERTRSHGNEVQLAGAR